VSKTISVFKSGERQFVRYLGNDESDGGAWIARLVGADISNTMGAGIVAYEKITVDWNLAFDEVITLIEGELHIHSGGSTFTLRPGDVAWFPAHTPLTYEVRDRAVVSYSVYPMPSPQTPA
jgi:ethanolamine utilization protein EutQ